MGTAMRQAVELANAGGLGPGDYRVLTAVLHVAASWSRLTVRCDAPELARLAGLSLRRTRDRLANLDRLGIITWAPKPGTRPDGKPRSLVGLPLTAPKGDAQASGLIRDAQASGLPSSKVTPTASGSNVTPERPVLREVDEKAAAAQAHAEEIPADFARLLESVPLADRRRRDVFKAWRREPGRVESCFAEYRRRLEKGTADGAGLLLRMIADGDDYQGAGGKPTSDPLAAAMAWAENAALKVAADDFDVLLADRKLSEEQAERVRARAVELRERAREPSPLETLDSRHRAQAAGALLGDDRREALVQPTKVPKRPWCNV